MLKLLPIGVVILIFISLIIFRSQILPGNKIEPPQISLSNPKEVPATNDTSERVKNLELVTGQIVDALKSNKSGNTLDIKTPNSLDSRVQVLEATIADLKARISKLETTAPTTPATASTKYPIYITFGSSGISEDGNWNSFNNSFLISLDPADYPGYSSMQLEVTGRLVDKVGTGYIRLYNLTDNSVTSSELSTTSTVFVNLTTNTFKPGGGRKNYILQVKTTDRQIQIQNAKIKVNF